MNLEARYPIVEVQPDWLLGVEPMGSKDKHWIRLPGDTQPWLFKFSRQSAGEVTGEHWAEKVVAEVAALLGVAHARVELARLNGQWGSISRRFDELARDNTELVHGNDLLAGFVTGYDPQKQRKQSDHTVTNVIRAIGHVFAVDNEMRAHREAALTMLAGYLVLDALVLNTDRHHENWGVIRRLDLEFGVVHSIAPSFDHASSLARNEPPAKLATWLSESGRVAWYAQRGQGGLYWDERDAKGANPLQLAMDAARKWPAYFEPWRQRLAGMQVEPLDRLVDRVPDEAMTAESKRFAKALLAHTLERLKTI
jgi:hypothetical protein